MNVRQKKPSLPFLQCFRKLTQKCQRNRLDIKSEAYIEGERNGNDIWIYIKEVVMRDNEATSISVALSKLKPFLTSAVIMNWERMEDMK